MSSTTESNAARFAWQSWLGVAAAVLGLLFAAAHGTEFTKQVVIQNATPASGVLPMAKCPEDELIEEGLSVAQCEQLVSEVRSFLASAPDWFPGYQATLSALATVLALVSIAVGAALVNERRWASGTAVVVFGALALVDAASFVGAANTGPILRGLYMWNFLLWLVIHLMMTAGAVAGRAALAGAPAEAADRRAA